MTAQLNARGDVAVLVPAAGAGLRLGPGGPKALRLLAGEPLLVHAIRRVAAAASVRLIVVAAPEQELASVRAMLAPVAPVLVVAGGAERQESVAKALAVVPTDIDIVLVHDAARALTPPTLIEAVAAAVRGGAPAVIPVLPVVDTIKEVAPAGPSTGAGAPPPAPAINAPSPPPADVTASSPPAGPPASSTSSPGALASPSPGASTASALSSGASTASPPAPGAPTSSVSCPGALASSSPGASTTSPSSPGAAVSSPSAGAAFSPSAGADTASSPGALAPSPAPGGSPVEVVLGTVDRSVLRSVQTPQGFRREVLAAAHAAAADPLTDDAGLVEKAGLPVTCVPGSELAMKITRPLDLILAEALLHVR